MFKLRLSIPLLALLGCSDPVNLPPVQGPPLATVLPSAEPDTAPVVRFVSPVGQAASTHLQITATFNKAMVPLAQVEKRCATPPLVIDPPVSGVQRWLSSRTVALIPDRKLPGSTRFSVRVVKGLKAVDGQTFQQDKRWSFSTEHLRVVRAHLRHSARRWAKPNQSIKIQFNQAVRPAQVAPFAAFEIHDKKKGTTRTIEANARRGSWYTNRLDKRLVVLWPKEPLPLGSRVHLRVRAGLRGAGPLKMKKDYRLAFSTYGPFRVIGLECAANCPPEGSVVLKLSNPAQSGDIRSATRIDGRRLPKSRRSYQTARVYLPLNLGPRKTYGITLRGALKDKFGQPLQGGRSFRLSTGDHAPFASMPTPSGVMESKGPKAVPLSFRNAKSAQLHYKRLTVEELVEILALRPDKAYRKLPGFSQRDLRVRGQRNKPTFVTVQADKLMGSKSSGVLALELTYALHQRPEPRIDSSTSTREMASGNPPGPLATGAATSTAPKIRRGQARRLLRITNLGLTGKYSPHDTLLWVTALDSGRPVAGAEVAIYRPGKKSPLWTGRTDKAGIARGPGTKDFDPHQAAERRYVYVVRKGKDFTYTESTTQSGIRPWDFNMNEAWEAGGLALRGMVFSDRGVYRPGQKVKLKGILRRMGEKQLEVPAGEATVRITDARGEKLLERKVELSSFGSFSLDLPLAAGANLGRYGVMARFEKGTVYGSFRVEEYRPAEFAVNVTPTTRHVIRGQSMRWSTNARYLFGAPMAKAGFRRYIRWSRSYFTPPGHEGFTFGDSVPFKRRYSAGGFVASQRGKLDVHGTVKASRTVMPAKMDHPRTYHIESTVRDVSRQTIAGRTNVLVHPARVYLGAKTRETFVRAKEELPVHIATPDHRGKRIAGVQVRGTLYHRTWEMVRQAGFRGGHRFITRPKETPVASCALTTTLATTPCKVSPPRAGYFVLRLRAVDGAKNPVHTSIGIYASGPDYVPWRRDKEHRIEIVKDRKVYGVGQKARLLIKSPFKNAHGLLTVERNGIYLRRPLLIKRTATWIDVPITPEMAPNAFVSVTLVRGRVRPPAKSKSDDDAGRPVIKMGYAKLVVDQASRRLGVKVTTDKKTYRPGQRVTVSLETRGADGKGAPAEVTLFVADEGVLSLTGYKTPDPMKTFYAERGLSVRTADNRIVLISRKLLKPKGTNPGGGGGGRGSPRGGARHRFASTPYFNPSVITDPQGHATVSFTLPDNLTRFRVMAVAVDRGQRFGSAHSSLTVRKPLLLLSALPRHLRVGDALEAGVVVHNHSGQGGDVKVRASVEGLTLASGNELTVRVENGAAKEARFRFNAKQPGEATLRFSAQLGDHKDIVEHRRPIRLPLVKEVVATSGATDGVVAEALQTGEGIRPDVGGLELTLASTALVGLRGSVDYLLNYPYECLEQTASRLVPLVLFGELADAFGLIKKNKLSPTIHKLIARIQQMQRWGGGFSLWPSSSNTSPWLTAYATWALHIAKSRGHKVSPKVLAGATRWLQRQLQVRLPKDASQARMSLATRAFVARVLSELGSVPQSRINALYERRVEMPVFARAQLLIAMRNGKSDAKAQKVLFDELLGQVHQTAQTAKVEESLGHHFAPLFHSSIRSTAMLLDALLTVRPKHPLVDKLVKYLLAQRKNGRWSNTQESVYALLGLRRYLEQRESSPPSFVAKVSLGSRWILEHSFRGRSLKVHSKRFSMQDIHGKKQLLGIHKAGKGRLHYTAKLTYARKELPKRPWDAGFFITRSYERVGEGVKKLRGGSSAHKKDAAASKALRAGDLVRVKLRLVVPQTMHYVAVNDPLPAGLEPLNFNLMTASRASRRHLGKEWWHTPFYHRELRDDRVQLFADTMPAGVYTYVYLTRATSIGSFVAPPTHVEQMYEPEVFGRTATDRLEVKAR